MTVQIIKLVMVHYVVVGFALVVQTITIVEHAEILVQQEHNVVMALA